MKAFIQITLALYGVLNILVASAGICGAGYALDSSEDLFSLSVAPAESQTVLVTGIIVILVCVLFHGIQFLWLVWDKHIPVEVRSRVLVFIGLGLLEFVWLYSLSSRQFPVGGERIVLVEYFNTILVSIGFGLFGAGQLVAALVLADTHSR